MLLPLPVNELVRTNGSNYWASHSIDLSLLCCERVSGQLEFHILVSQFSGNQEKKRESEAMTPGFATHSNLF